MSRLGEQIGGRGRIGALLLPVVGITKLDILSPFVVAVRSGFWDGWGFRKLLFQIIPCQPTATAQRSLADFEAWFLWRMK